MKGAASLAALFQFLRLNGYSTEIVYGLTLRPAGASSNGTNGGLCCPQGVSWPQLSELNSYTPSLRLGFIGTGAASSSHRNWSRWAKTCLSWNWRKRSSV